MDRILGSWLKAQREEATALADDSDLLDVWPLDPQRFLARFCNKGLVRAHDGEVREANHFEVEYWFKEDYLRRVPRPLEVLTWIHPLEVIHPNVRPPLCCVGFITPGTSLVDLLYRTYEVISYQNVMPKEDDALDLDACQWARHNQHRFPVDVRPLKRRGPRREAQEPPR
jgi:hypothetical protein